MNTFRVIVLTVFIGLYSCNVDRGDTAANDPGPNDSVSLEKEPAASDTVVISTKTVVICSAGSEQIEKLKLSMPEDDFYVIADDHQYYQYEANVFFDSIGIDVVNVTGGAVVKFTGTNGANAIIGLDSMPGLGCIYFFDPAKAHSKLIDMTSPQEEYVEYFGKE